MGKYVFLTFFCLLLLLFPSTFLLVNQLEVLLLKHEVRFFLRRADRHGR